jgi:hypothetical protein
MAKQERALLESNPRPHTACPEAHFSSTFNLQPREFVMSHPPHPWLTCNQLAQASERGVLAILDTTLELTLTLLTKLPTEVRPWTIQPPTPQKALVASMLTLTGSLRELIAGYQALLDSTCSSALDEPTDPDDFDDLPF